MKLCDLTQFYSPLSGGVKRYLHGKLDYLLQRTDHRHLLIVPGPADRTSGEDPARTIEIRSPRLPGTFSYRLLLRRGRIRQVLEQERPDLIEVGDSWQLAWWLSTIGSRLGIPVIAYYHSDLPRALEDGFRLWFGNWAASTLRVVLRPYLRRTFGRMDATLVASERLIAALREHGLPNLRFAPMGVDTRRFRPLGDPATTRAEKGVPAGRVLLLYVGRLSADKNTRSLLRMMPILNPSGEPRFHLGLVGDGPQRDLVRAEAARRNDITWFGYLKEDSDVARLYSAADLMVHPGICETYGLTMLEAQACGAPVVSVRGGGADDLNLCGETFLAGSARPEALAGCIRSALPQVTDATRSALVREVAARFDNDRCFAQEIAIYEEIVATHRRRAAAI